jgi:integrase
MRKGELRALEWGDLDFRGRFIEVRRGFSKENLSTPKSGKPRRVDMSDQLAAVLTDHKRNLAAAALKAGVPFPEWVFRSRTWGPRDESNLDGCFKRCLRKAKIRDIRFHDLRHSVASWLLSASVSPAYVHAMLGHSTIKLTVDTYGHVLPSANRTAANSLDGPKWREIRNLSATKGQAAEVMGG